MAGLTQLFVAILAVASLVDAARSDFCKLKTCDPREHTMCRFASPKPSAQCGIVHSVSLTREERKEVLQAHNKFRARVASGRETRGITGRQPAGYIGPLKWDKELAAVAQRWANQCDFNHDACRNVGRFHAGQNIAYRSWSNGYNTKLSEIVQLWSDEVNNFDKRTVESYIYDYKTSHYTQMVWGATTTIGCGLVRYKRDGFYTTYLVCNYGPRGNMVGQPMYKTR